MEVDRVSSWNKCRSVLTTSLLHIILDLIQYCFLHGQIKNALFISFYLRSTALYCVICKSSELCLKIWSAFHREGSSYEGPKGKYFLSKQALWLLREEEILKASKNQRKPKPRMRFRSKPKTTCKTINVIQRWELGKFAKNSFKQPIL